MSPKNLSRREFLQLSLLGSAALTSNRLSVLPMRSALQTQPLNVLFVVYDSWSACHLDFAGYPRETMPHLNKLAEKAIVYHNHYAGGNFTTPGTASLLTGTAAQTHRAFSGNSKVIASLENANLFSLFQGSGYHTIAYTHNNYANTLLNQFSAYIDNLIPRHSLFLNKSELFNALFGKDYDTAFLSQDQILVDTPSNSLLLSKIYEKWHQRKIERITAAYQDLFPGGLPAAGGDNYFILEDATDFIIDQSGTYPTPFLGYFHLMPPHSPYRPPAEFAGTFADDGAEFPRKPKHILTEGHTRKFLLDQRQSYDNFLRYVDDEFHRLYTALEAAGALENTLVVLTSDHGEMFERGIVHHGKATLHEPVIRVPLYLFLPGQTGRVDITEVTTALDILPTLLHLAGTPAPESVEGGVLPPFADSAPFAHQPYFMVHAATTHYPQPVSAGTMMVLHEGYKLTRYQGYEQLEGQPYYELYNLMEDPQELHELSASQPERVAQLDAEIEKMLKKSNRPYQS